MLAVEFMMQGAAMVCTLTDTRDSQIMTVFCSAAPPVLRRILGPALFSLNIDAGHRAATGRCHAPNCLR